MKILWLSHLIPFPPKGGVLQRAYHLLRQAAKAGEVDLIAFIQRDLLKIHYPDFESGLSDCRDGLGFCNSLKFIEIPCDLKANGKAMLALRSLFSRHPYTINWLASREFSRTVAESAGHKRYDLVHFDTISLAPYRALVGNVPITLDHHNVESQMMIRRAQNETNLLKRLYFLQEGYRLQRYEKSVCGQFSSNLMCSELDAARLREFAGNATTDVIPNGVDPEYFVPSTAAPQPNVCIFAGRLNSYPNAQAVRFIVSELWPRMKRESPDLQFHLVGPNAPREATELAARDASFRVVGFVEDVRPSLDDAAIYVCPMFDGGGTRLKVLDAMAMRKPIVATSMAVEGIDVRHGYNVHIAETPGEFTAAVKRLRAEPEYAAALGRNARQTVLDRYSYDAIGRDLQRVFQRAAGSRSHA